MLYEIGDVVMIDFVIIEDNAKYKEKIKKLVVSFMMSNKLEFNILVFEDFTSNLVKYINTKNTETIYFIDLQLTTSDGIDIARHIRNKANDWRSPIIIYTAHTNLAFEVYKQRLQILDFIGKKDNDENYILESLDICIKMLNKLNVYRYTYKNIEHCISYDEINYIQREERRIAIVTKNKKYHQNISINKIKLLLPNYFVRSTKGTLLNINNVKEIDWNESLVYFKNDTKDYVVSKSHKKEIEQNGIK